MLRKGHQGVKLDAESWDRLVTWIDLNAPCHGTWGEVYPIPDGARERRMALRRQYGGPKEDPEAIPLAEGGMPRAECRTSDPTARSRTTEEGDAVPAPRESDGDGSSTTSPFVSQASPLPRKTVDLGSGLSLTLVRIPAGEFTMGDPDGEPDERPPSRVAIPRAFWMASCEITNEQFRGFHPSHDSRYYQKRYPPLEVGVPAWVGPDARGLTLDGDRQPAVRVSWDEAMAFCRWLSARTGLRFSLPTEAQWECACRAGTTTPLSFGAADADFSRWANLADASFARGLGTDGKQVTGGLEHLVLEGAALSDARFDDGAAVTAEVGKLQPNAWGLHDLHGNAAEWTRTTYAAYPYRDGGGRDGARPEGRKEDRPRNQDGARPGRRDAAQSGGPGDAHSEGCEIAQAGGRSDAQSAGSARSQPEKRKVVRGGSFFDPPGRARSAFRLAYPSWQRVFNVGFRVVCEGDP
jgi:formylglycine-generating enzyme required for sulfatase activity